MNCYTMTFRRCLTQRPVLREFKRCFSHCLWRFIRRRTIPVLSQKTSSNKLSSVGAPNTTTYSVWMQTYPRHLKAMEKSCDNFLLKSHGTCLNLFKRPLVSRSRRGVSFGLADHLYRTVVDPNVNATETVNAKILHTLKNSTNKTEYLKSLTDEELLACVYTSAERDTIKSQLRSVVHDIYQEKHAGNEKMLDLQKLLQNEVLQRVKFMDSDTLFKFAHAVFRTRDPTLRFYSHFFGYVLENYDDLSLSTPDYVKILFFIYFHGDAPDALLFKLEQYLAENIDGMSASDLHMIALGFFRANKRITDFSLLSKIADKLLNNLDNISADVLVSILKILRHSSFAKVRFFMELAEELNSHKLLQTASLNHVMHLSLTYGSLKVFHQGLLDTLLGRSKELMENKPTNEIRTKDLGRLVWALGTFIHMDEEFIRIVCSFFKAILAKRGKMFFPESLVDVAIGMAYVGEYPEDVINAVLSLETAVMLRDHPLLEKSNQLLYLNESVKIEQPSYKGNILTQAFINTLPDKVYGDLHRELSFRQGLEVSYRTLQMILGKECVSCHFILPHFQTADIELHLDANGQPLEIRTESEGNVPNQSNQKRKRIAVQLIGQNQCAVNSDRLLGITQSKLRQLNKLGYHTQLIMPEEAKRLDVMNETTRQEYFKSLLESQFNAKI